jgi:drug/metabolite transporter (DMT)-like permease
MPKWLIYSLLTLLFWGGWGAVSKVIGNSMSASQSQAFSTLGVLPTIIALLFAKGIRSGINKPRGSMYAFGAGIIVGLGNLALYQALQEGGKAVTLIPLTALYPLITVLLATLLLKESLNQVQKAGVVIALAAIYLFNGGSDTDVSARSLVYALVPIVLWGTGALIQKVSTNYVSNELSTLWFLGSFLPIAAVILVSQPMQWTIPAKDWILVLALGVLFSLGNLTLIAAYGNEGKASIVTPLAGLYPIITVPLAVGLLGEKVNGRELAGIVLSLVSVVALSRETRANKTEPVTPT